MITVSHFQLESCLFDLHDAPMDRFHRYSADVEGINFSRHWDRVIVGLSTSIEADGTTFRPAPSQHGLDLFGDLRWQGWIDAMQSGYADHLVVVGGLERIPPPHSDLALKLSVGRESSDLLVPRCLAAIQILSTNHGLDPASLGYCISEGNTGGNAEAIRQLRGALAEGSQLIVSTSHYHIPRIHIDLQHNGMNDVLLLPSESLSAARHLKNGMDRREVANNLTAALGASPLAERSVSEIIGIADKINGTYRALSA